MHTTPLTLLQKLRAPNQPEAWARFVDLYTPLLLTWARLLGLQPQDRADLVQDVFVALLQQLPKFRYDPARHNFRGWLRTLCFNKWRDQQRLRAAQMPNASPIDLAGLKAPDDAERFLEQEHNRYLVRQALQILDNLKLEFEPQTLQVCWETVVQQRPVAEVAQQLGISANAVYVARLRVLRRLRQELAEFLT